MKRHLPEELTPDTEIYSRDQNQVLPEIIGTEDNNYRDRVETVSWITVNIYLKCRTVKRDRETLMATPGAS